MTKVFLILIQFYYSASFCVKELIGCDYEYFLSDNFAFSCEGSYSGGFAGISYINKNYCFNFSVIGNNNYIKCLIGPINSYGKFLGYFNINYSEYFKNSKLDWNVGIKMNVQLYIYKNHNLYVHFKSKIDKEILKFNKQKNSCVDENDLSFITSSDVISCCPQNLQTVLKEKSFDYISINSDKSKCSSDSDSFGLSTSYKEDDVGSLNVNNDVNPFSSFVEKDCIHTLVYGDLPYCNFASNVQKTDNEESTDLFLTVVYEGLSNYWQFYENDSAKKEENDKIATVLNDDFQ